MIRKNLIQGTLVLASAIVVLAAAGCQGGASAMQSPNVGEVRTPTASAPSLPATANPPSGPATPAAATCVSSDPNHICIGLKFVSYVDSAGVPVVERPAADTLVGAMNDIWKTCNIAFQIDDYEQDDPTKSGLSYGSASQNESSQIRSTYGDSSHFLVVTTGPWTGNYIAWTQMPGSGPYGVVVDQEFSTAANVVGHELGHYMGLDHISDTSNLMNPVEGPTTVGLSASQCDTARSTDLNFWPSMLRK